MRSSADTSVLVAAFASWHEHHELAFGALARIDTVIAHCLLETFSVLTRMPAPHRMTPDTVSEYLDATFGEHDVIALPAAQHRALVGICRAKGLVGGAIYDALIGATCSHEGVQLLTLDARARTTYNALGTRHEILG